ncbi:PREDICTED: guanine nucleotide-binding protein subunit alpha-15-like [Gekko japonicus]|uniref:Guanine nucleotide-binding protein subunit alpha-15-like n=1 Tax=Gekko japonicus TaxID=146911 RepID=A0ABM1KYL7_GEKJA|nr:PREDICTED: guanine nucleotide-binding protein subunit alpha-15-like [Gekko japonicus]
MVWCSCFLSEEEKTAIAIDKEINRLLQEQKKREKRELKLLLLGTGESGKSTFIKQMRIIHGVGFSEEDRKGFAKVVYQNIFSCIQAMIKAMETLQISFAQSENVRNAQLLMGVDAYKVTMLETHHVRMLESLWKDPGIQACYQRRREYHLLDSTFYFLSNLDRIGAAGYIPGAQDILRTRVPTTGINEYCFLVQKVTLRVTCDASALFPGPKQDAEAAKEFVLEMYMDVYQRSSIPSHSSSMQISKDAHGPRILYPHYTCATDTQNICTVFDDIKDVVLATYLEEFNLS